METKQVEKTETLNLKIDKSIKVILKKMAEKERRSVSQQVAMIILEAQARRTRASKRKE